MSRKNHPPEFKARVALEAPKELKTLNELTSQYGVHPNQVSTPGYTINRKHVQRLMYHMVLEAHPCYSMAIRG